jgi:putative membrane protein
MVVQYPTAAEASVWSFLIYTPSVILHYRGSIIPQLLPQVVIAVALSVVALYWNPYADSAGPLQGYTVVGVLLSFLMVFKTQTAYNQFWTALSHVENTMNLSRGLARAVCTLLDWEKADVISRRARRIVRLICLHWFIIIEYFERTPPNPTMHAKAQDALRRDIRCLSGPNEFAALYGGDHYDTPGSKSNIPYSRPTLVLFWIQSVLCTCAKEGGVLNAPALVNMVQLLAQLEKEFYSMNRIDKLQFPLPYAQIVKLLCVVWVFTLPFVLVPSCGNFTPVFMALIAIGFFGLDEVAEVLESPFGDDPNDIDLKSYGSNLVKDLELVYYARNSQEDYVLDDTNIDEVNLSDLLGSKGKDEEVNECATFFKSRNAPTLDGSKVFSSLDAVVPEPPGTAPAQLS